MNMQRNDVLIVQNLCEKLERKLELTILMRLSKRLSIYFDSVPHLNKAFEGKAHLHEFEGNRKVHEVHADVLEKVV